MAEFPFASPKTALLVDTRHRKVKVPCLFTHPQKMVNAKSRAEAVCALLAVLKPGQIKQHSAAL